MTDALPPDAPFRRAFDAARDPYTARNALGITLDSLVFTGDPQAPTPPAGDNDTSIATTAFVTTAIGVPQCGRLTYVSATQLLFAPLNGDRIKINGAICAIPSAGITGLGNTGVFVNGTGGQNLAASTLYYVYAFNNGGTITADFSTTAHARSTTAGNVGVEIKSGNDSRTLVGMILTNSSSQFANSAQFRWVRTWFNDKGVVAFKVFGSNYNTTSSTLVELSSAERVQFLNWSGENILLIGQGEASINTIGNSSLAVGFDGSGISASVSYSAASTAIVAISPSPVSQALAEGSHYALLLGATTPGWTSTFYSSSCGVAVTTLGN